MREKNNIGSTTLNNLLCKSIYLSQSQELISFAFLSHNEPLTLKELFSTNLSISSIYLSFEIYLKIKTKTPLILIFHTPQQKKRKKREREKLTCTT